MSSEAWALHRARILESERIAVHADKQAEIYEGLAATEKDQEAHHINRMKAGHWRIVALWARARQAPAGDAK